MPRAPSEKAKEAEKLYRKGIPLVDIAKKLDVSAGTVRSWKNRYGWDDKAKKNSRNVATKSNVKSNADATLQKKKSGAPPGNQNAKGGRGNPSPKKPIKHGVYAQPFMDALGEDEQELVDSMSDDAELLLIGEIQLASIRERRILQAINKLREQKGDVVVADVTRSEEKRSFRDEEEEAEYNRRQKAKVDAGELLPGKSYNIQTHTINKDVTLARWEQELSSVQSKKTKAIEALYKYRFECQKADNENNGNEMVDDWMAGIIGDKHE